MPAPTPIAPAPAPKTDAHVMSARERVSEMSRRNKALERLKEKVQGAKDGAVDGEVSEAALAIIGNQYGTEVRRCLRANYTVHGVDEAKVAGLKAVVLIRIQADGKIISHKIEESSGNAAVDQAVERAVQRCGQVPPPPPEIRDTVRDDGFDFVFGSED